MYTAHNDIRHGTTGLNLAAGRETETRDWAILLLTSAAHGHGHFAKELTRRDCFGTNIVGKTTRDRCNKRSKPTSTTEGSTAAEAPNSRLRTYNHNGTPESSRGLFTQGADLNINEVRGHTAIIDVHISG